MSRALLAATAAGCLVLTGCASTVALQSAPNSGASACADISVRLPSDLVGKERRWTTAQATAAWGDPAAVLFTCGVTPPGATTMPCRTVDGVDWLVDDTDAPRTLVTTFGRVPAVQLYIDTDPTSGVSSIDALTALGPLISAYTTVTSECTAHGGATAAPTP